MDVKKDSILITFYNSDLGKNFVVLESEDWKNMLLRAEAEIQKRKENWAADHTCACEDCPRSL